MLRTVGLMALLAAATVAVAVPAANLQLRTAGQDPLTQAEIAAAANLVCNGSYPDSAYAFYIQSPCVSEMISAATAQTDGPNVIVADADLAGATLASAR